MRQLFKDAAEAAGICGRGLVVLSRLHAYELKAFALFLVMSSSIMAATVAGALYERSRAFSDTVAAAHVPATVGFYYAPMAAKPVASKAKRR